MTVLIVGAGLIGISSAYYLAKHGEKVIVIESHPNSGLACSYANAGMLSPALSSPFNAPDAYKEFLNSLINKHSPLAIKPSQLLTHIPWFIQFCKNSRRNKFNCALDSNLALSNYNLTLMQTLLKEHSLKINHGKGTLMIFRNPKDYKDYLQRNKILREFGNQGLKIERDDLHNYEPNLNLTKGDIIGGIYYAADQYGDAYAYCQQMTEVCKQLGVTFHYNTKVNNILFKNQNIIEILTSQGPFSASQYLLAAGCYTPTLAKLIKLNLPIKPGKGYSITAHTDLKKPIFTSCLFDYNNHVALTALGQNLRLGGILEFAGYNYTINQQRIQQLIAIAKQNLSPSALPHIKLDSANAWVGLRPLSASGVPIISQSRYKNLYINSGHGHLGWTMAAGSGKLICDLMRGIKTDIDPSPYTQPGIKLGVRHRSISGERHHSSSSRASA